MTKQQLKKWLDDYKAVWLQKKPEESINLVADIFVWYESPFDPPIKTRNQLITEWKNVLKQRDISLNIEILSVNDDCGIARWSAVFTIISTKKTLIYDGILLVKLNSQGKCTYYFQWFNKKEK